MYDSPTSQDFNGGFSEQENAYEDELDSFSDVYNESRRRTGVTAEYRGSRNDGSSYTYKRKESRIDSTIEGLGDAYIENERKASAANFERLVNEVGLHELFRNICARVAHGSQSL